MRTLLIPGLWLDGTVWQEVVSGLAEHGIEGVPLTLPGQGDGDATATYEDQVRAVVEAVDGAAASGEPVVVVGHSAASALAWVAADARPGRVAGVVMIGGMPVADGDEYANWFEATDGMIPFPGWQRFEVPDVADLDEAMRDDLAGRTVAFPAAVAQGVVRLQDPRRFEVPTVMLCPEYTPEEARAWIDSGDVPELPQAADLRLVDLDTGHWPMASNPRLLAATLAEVATPWAGTTPGEDGVR